MKVRFYSSNGFAMGRREEVIEFDDDMTDDDLEEEARVWFWNYHEYGFEKLPEGDEQ